MTGGHETATFALVQRTGPIGNWFRPDRTVRIKSRRSRATVAMTDRDDDPTPLTEPQQIPNDSDLGDQAPDLPDALQGDEEEIREPGI
jgi:hypothetical protein